MKKYILANWKAHKTRAEAEAWLLAFHRFYQPHPDVKVILAPSAVHLAPMYGKLLEYDLAQLSLAAQDLSPFPLGSYTGALPAEMVRDLVDFAILGHSERRRYFHETNQEVANKVREAALVGIKSIVCLDQPYVRSQVAALAEEDLGDLIIGYGPVEAIGIDIPQSVEKTMEVISEILTIVPDRPVLYGGSINKNNAGDYLKIAGVAGLMVGTASLDPEEFASICDAASQI